MAKSIDTRCSPWVEIEVIQLMLLGLRIGARLSWIWFQVVKAIMGLGFKASSLGIMGLGFRASSLGIGKWTVGSYITISPK